MCPLQCSSVLLYWFNQIICVKYLAHTVKTLIPLSFTPPWKGFMFTCSIFLSGVFLLCFCRHLRGQVRPCWDPDPQVPPAETHPSQESWWQGVGHKIPSSPVERGWLCCESNSFCFHSVSAFDHTSWFLERETENVTISETRGIQQIFCEVKVFLILWKWTQGDFYIFTHYTVSLFLKSHSQPVTNHKTQFSKIIFYFINLWGHYFFFL